MRRGDVVRVRLRPGSGHEQHGPRFAVIVQSDLLEALSTVLIAPTSRSARPARFRPEIEVEGTTTRVLAEQTGAVDRTRLGALVGHLSPDELWGVDLAVELCLDLHR